MNLKSIIYAFSLLFIISCESEKAYQLNIVNPLLYVKGGKFTITVDSKNERYFEGKIIVDGKKLTDFQITSSPNPDPTEIEFGIKELLESEAIEEMISNNRLGVNIILFNEDKKIRLDTTVQFEFIVPPIISNLKIIEPRQLGGKINLLPRVDFIKNLIQNGGHGVYNPDSKLLSTIFSDTATSVKVSLLMDTVYEKSIIVRWPNPKNKSDKFEDFQTVLTDFSKYYEEMWNDQKENKSQQIIVERKIKMRYSGLSDFYLILYKSKYEYTYVKLFEAITDNIKPSFSQFNSGFYGDPTFEGHVNLRNEHFFGYRPYRVPFIGTVYGDVKQVLLEGVPINFKIGEEFYLKRTLDLDDGYNRVSVTVIDKRGNITKSFIPITLERMDDNQIKIENNIDIDNN